MIPFYGKNNALKFLVLLIPALLLDIHMLPAQLSPVWVERFAGEGDNSDRYNDIASDAGNNFYLAGYAYSNDQQKDFLVIKTDGNGDTLWTRTWNGTNNGDDEANAIAVDAAGNVYATGYTDGDKSKYDFLTIKYDNAGNLLWSAVYNYTGAINDDIAVAIAVDSAGNVYITGTSDQSQTSASNKDYATVKYDASGNEVFVARHNGFGNDKDEPVAIAVDNAGNCYVTGRSDSGGDDDYVTIKYNSAGIAQWNKLYDGGNGDDRAAAMIITPAGDIVVTGRQDAGSDDDITTICYAASGVQLWIKTFNGSGNGNDHAAAITADASGNIYVTGESDVDPSFNANIDIAVIKYSASGVFQWAQYKGVTAGSNTDSPKSIVTDANGNVLVTGKSDTDASAVVNDDIVIIKFDAAGVEQWTRTAGGSSNLEDGGYSLVTDTAGNAIIAGKADNSLTRLDGALLKYDPAGNLLFNKNYNGDGDFSDNSFVVKTDPAGNVFIAGYTFATDHNRDILIRKYDSGGNLLKSYQYNGTKSDEDEIADLVIDATGNIYAAGFTKSSGTSSDFITIKLDNNLDTLWMRFYNYTVNESDKAVSIALDANNNVYVTGYSDNNPSDTVDSYDIVTIKYNSAGTSQWTNRYNPPANGDDKPVEVSVDQNGNTVVSGTSWNGSSDDMVTLHYDPTGQVQWILNYNGTANGNDKAAAMVLDSNGNIYVTGSSFSGINYDDYATIKYDQAGTQQWVKTWNGAGNDDDKPRGIALDPFNNIIVTGQSDADADTSVKNYNYVTVKYDNAGNFQWMAAYDGTSATDDIPSAVVTDDMGNIYVAGESENGSSLSPDKDYAFVIYDPAGTQMYYSIYNGPASATDGANSICIDGTAIYVTGNSNGGISHKDMATIQYAIPVGIKENEIADVQSFIYPNPASDNIEIVLTSLPSDLASGYSIEFFDLPGKKVKSLEITAGALKTTVKDFPAGMYFYKVSGNSKILATGKFIKQ
jgi:uncharacterized delta-60 repeat protein